MSLTIETSFNENLRKTYNITNSLTDLIQENILNEDILLIALSVAEQIEMFNDFSNRKNYRALNNLLKNVKSKKVTTNELKIHTKKIDNDYIKTFVYKYTINGVTKIIKLYNYNSSQNKTIDFRIVNEIACQEYSFKKSTECNFNVPRIFEYRKIYINVDENNKNNTFIYDTIFYIIMEYVDLPTLNNFFYDNKDKNICKNIVNKLNNIIKCMERNNIYHNDLHLNNILINYINIDDYSIYIIDYGESTNTDPSIFTSQLKNNSLCSSIKNNRFENIMIIPKKIDPVNRNNQNIISGVILPSIKGAPKIEKRKMMRNRNRDKKPPTPTLQGIYNRYQLLPNIHSKK